MWFDGWIGEIKLERVNKEHLLRRRAVTRGDDRLGKGFKNGNTVVENICMLIELFQ